MIEKYLYILLQHYDEVIIPNLGAFLATYSSSQIQSSKIKPPHKKIVFYPQLNFDKSALLKKTIVYEEDITEGEFDVILEHFLNEIEENITFKFKAHLDKIGTLTRKPNGDLHFEQSDESNLLVESFGLPNLDAKPINPNATSGDSEKKTIKKEEPTTKFENSKKEEKTMNSDYNYTNPEEDEGDKNSLLVWLIIIPLAFILIFLVYFYAFQKDKLEDFKSYITGEDGDQITQVEEEIIPEVIEEEEQPIDTIKIEKDTAKVEEVAEVIEEEETIPIKVEKRDPIIVSGDGVLTEKTNRYYIIVGGFGNMDTAKKFRQTLASHGYKVSFIPHYKRDDYYRVALVDFESEREAYNKRSQLRVNYPNAWVIKY
jgi:hypothetical protein